MNNKTKRLLIASAFVLAGIALIGTSLASCSSPANQHAAKERAQEKQSDETATKMLSGFAPAKPPELKTAKRTDYAPWDAKPKGGKSHE